MRFLRWIPLFVALLLSASIARGQTVEDRARELIRELMKDPPVVIVEDETQAGNLNGPAGPHANYQVTTKIEPGSPEYEAKVAQLREKRRRDIQAKLVALGPPAVPVICQALADQALPYREYLAEVLAQIGDMRAAPCLIEYLKEGLSITRYADSLAKQGEHEMAEEQRKKGTLQVRAALSSLEALTGQTFGRDIARWQAWWKQYKNYYYTP